MNFEFFKVIFTDKYRMTLEEPDECFRDLKQAARWRQCDDMGWNYRQLLNYSNLMKN